MAFIKKDDIVGFRFDSEVVCTDCVTQEDLQDLKQHNIITEDEVEQADGHFFCDRCKEEI